MDLRLFGPVELVDDRVTIDLGPPRQRLVLACIAADAPRPVSFAAVVDRVWSSEPPASVQRTLYVYISRLRSLSGRALRRVAGGYRLDLENSTFALLG